MCDTCLTTYAILMAGLADGFSNLVTGQGRINPTFFRDAFFLCRGPFLTFLFAAIGIWAFTRARGCIPRLGFVIAVIGGLMFGGIHAVFWLIYSAIEWASA